MSKARSSNIASIQVRLAQLKKTQPRLYAAKNKKQKEVTKNSLENDLIKECEQRQAVYLSLHHYDFYVSETDVPDVETANAFKEVFARMLLITAQYTNALRKAWHELTLLLVENDVVSVLDEMQNGKIVASGLEEKLAMDFMNETDEIIKLDILEISFDLMFAKLDNACALRDTFNKRFVNYNVEKDLCSRFPVFKNKNQLVKNLIQQKVRSAQTLLKNFLEARVLLIEDIDSANIMNMRHWQKEIIQNFHFQCKQHVNYKTINKLRNQIESQCKALIQFYENNITSIQPFHDEHWIKQTINAVSANAVITNLNKKEAVSHPISSSTSASEIKFDTHSKPFSEEACKQGNLEEVKSSLPKKIKNTRAKHIKGLYLACENGHLDIVKCLYSKIAFKDAINTCLAETDKNALMIAAEKGHKAIVSYLLTTTKAKADHVNNAGKTALDFTTDVSITDLLKRKLSSAPITDNETTALSSDADVLIEIKEESKPEPASTNEVLSSTTTREKEIIGYFLQAEDKVTELSEKIVSIQAIIKKLESLCADPSDNRAGLYRFRLKPCEEKAASLDLYAKQFNALKSKLSAQVNDAAQKQKEHQRVYRTISNDLEQLDILEMSAKANLQRLQSRTKSMTKSASNKTDEKHASSKKVKAKTKAATSSLDTTILPPPSFSPALSAQFSSPADEKATSVNSTFFNNNPGTSITVWDHINAKSYESFIQRKFENMRQCMEMKLKIENKSDQIIARCIQIDALLFENMQLLEKLASLRDGIANVLSQQEAEHLRNRLVHRKWVQGVNALELINNDLAEEKRGPEIEALYEKVHSFSCKLQACLNNKDSDALKRLQADEFYRDLIKSPREEISENERYSYGMTFTHKYDRYSKIGIQYDIPKNVCASAKRMINIRGSICGPENLEGCSHSVAITDRHDLFIDANPQILDVYSKNPNVKSLSS